MSALEQEAVDLCNARLPTDMPPENRAALGMDALVGAAMRFAADQGCSPLDFVWGLRQFASALEQSIVRRAQAQFEDIVGPALPGELVEEIDDLIAQAEAAMKEPPGSAT